MNNTELVNELQKFGKVKVRHYRHIQYTNSLVSMYEIRGLREQEVILPYGGKTEASIEIGDYKFTATAHCSTKDKFQRKVGTNLALTRLMDLHFMFEA